MDKADKIVAIIGFAILGIVITVVVLVSGHVISVVDDRNICIDNAQKIYDGDPESSMDDYNTSMDYCNNQFINNLFTWD